MTRAHRRGDGDLPGAGPRRRPVASEVEEMLYLGELRLAVEGARTPAEERLAQRHAAAPAGRAPH